VRRPSCAPLRELDARTAHGRNLTIVRYPAFTRLVQVGLPNRLRGEIWEVTSGAIHLRTANSGEYERILAAHEGKTSLSTEEIEKDLNRSLPEYPGAGARTYHDFSSGQRAQRTRLPRAYRRSGEC
jgi:hypothetical protein